MRRTLALAAALAAVAAALPATAATEACVDKALANALAALPGFQVAALEAGGGARVVLKREQPPLWLMLSAGFRENGLNTFAYSRGEGSSSQVPRDVEGPLNKAWDLWANDADAKACAALRMAEAPVPEVEYGRLDKMFQALQPVADVPVPTADDPAGTGGWMVAVGIGVLALALGIALVLLRRRKAAPPAGAKPTEPPPSPPAPGQDG